jgi:pre-rRNA-processing protein TSR2
LFARGVIARLAVWPTLRIAVDQGWGGPSSAEKRTWLASVLVDTFEEASPVPDEEYITDMLLQIMEDEFDCNIEDGSAESVARDMVRMWEESGTGREEGVRSLETQAERIKGKKFDVKVEEAMEEGSDWEDEEGGSDEDEAMDNGEEVPTLVPARDNHSEEEPEVDEEGFTLVKSKGKARR